METKKTRMDLDGDTKATLQTWSQTHRNAYETLMNALAGGGQAPCEMNSLKQQT